LYEYFDYISLLPEYICRLEIWSLYTPLKFGVYIKEVLIKNLAWEIFEQALQQQKTSALTYDFYCFKHLKIIPLWQKLTTEKKCNAGMFFSFQKNTYTYIL